MTLSKRTILIIVSTFIALLFILATTSDLILLSSYSKLENSEITSDAQNISGYIDDKLKQLNMAAQEVAEQLQEPGGFPAASGNLFTKHFFRAHSLDIAAVYDSSARLVVIRGFNNGKNRIRLVSAEQEQIIAGLASSIARGEAATEMGVVNLAGSPALIAFNRVRESRGAKRGVVATGWFVDCVELERIFRASGVSISTHDLHAPLSPDVRKAASAIGSGARAYAGVVDTSSVAGYFALKDIYGQPAFIVRNIENRTLYEHGKDTIVYIFTSLFLAGAILCCVMLIFIRGTILMRLQSLTNRVRQITETRDISARVSLSHHEDELQTLAVSINSMLDSLENAEAGMRESEERYRMLFEQAPDAIIIIGLEGDESGRIVAANQAAADLHGYTPGELCQLNIHDLNTEETNKIAGNITAKIVAGEWVTSELWHRKKNGTQFPIEMHAGLIKIGGRKYILGFDRDITQRKITEETDQMHLAQIRQLNDELSRKAIDLAAANNELEAFNYSVSHDMRGPLTRISGYCQLLLYDDCNLDPVAREYITHIYESETWLNDMIEALLHLATVSRVEIVSGSVNLSIFAEAVLKELSFENPDRTVITRIEPDIVVAGDTSLLKMVMINLLNNAWKYSSGKSDAVIEFGVDKSGSDPVYYVRDNGAGFNMKDADSLFRVFKRLHKSSQFEGTGIGLATVQRIIFRHGGLIWAEAEPGAGATFYFTLP